MPIQIPNIPSGIGAGDPMGIKVCNAPHNNVGVSIFRRPSKSVLGSSGGGVGVFQDPMGNL